MCQLVPIELEYFGVVPVYSIDTGNWVAALQENTMRALIVEDDPTSAKILEHVLSTYGHCDIAKDGKAGVEAFQHALKAGQPYDLICMDIMLPKLSGQDALQLIRKTEEEAGIPSADKAHVFMTTGLKETNEVAQALYKGGAAAFFVKPINIDSFIDSLKSVGLIESAINPS